MKLAVVGSINMDMTVTAERIAGRLDLPAEERGSRPVKNLPDGIALHIPCGKSVEVRAEEQIAVVLDVNAAERRKTGFAFRQMTADLNCAGICTGVHPAAESGHGGLQTHPVFGIVVASPDLDGGIVRLERGLQPVTVVGNLLCGEIHETLKNYFIRPEPRQSLRNLRRCGDVFIRERAEKHQMPSALVQKRQIRADLFKHSFSANAVVIFRISVQRDVNGPEAVVQNGGMTVRKSAVGHDSEGELHAMQPFRQFVEAGMQKRFSSPEDDLRTRTVIPHLFCQRDPFLIGKLLPVAAGKHPVLLSAEDAFQIAASGQLEVHGNDFREKHKPYLDY